MNQSHPNQLNAKINDGLLLELQDNVKRLEVLGEKHLLDSRILGKDKKKSQKKKDKNKKNKKNKDKKKDKKKKDGKNKKDKEEKKGEKKKEQKKKIVDGFSNFTNFGIPMGLMADSYKATHFEMYPEALKMVAYGEFRLPYKDLGGKEGRFVSYGMRNLIEKYLQTPWTDDDVDRAKEFYATHNVGHKPFPFPEQLFRKFVRENKGYFPVKIQCLRDGTVAHIHVPLYQITAEGEYSRLVTYLETVLTHVWYTSTVATLSRKSREIIERAFKDSVDDENKFLLDSRLHDFGFRGCTCMEQAVMGGSAHLLSFDGTDTMPAAYYVQYHLNNGKPVGTSIPATEHSVMTSFARERDAFSHMIDTYGEGVFACVMDSYDYANALDNIVPSLAEKKVKKGGFMVYRPDSGDPVEAVLMGLNAAEKTFGATVNKKGFKVPNNVGVIQGDGIGVTTMDKILDKVLENKFSAQSVAFGMGSGLLQKLNRDTMSFATKLSYIKYKDGRERNVMKKPKTDMDKISLPGILKVVRNEQGIPTVYPADYEGAKGPDLLETIWDSGPVAAYKFDSFDDMRKRVREDWDKLPPNYDPRSEPLKQKINQWIEEFNKSDATK